MDVIRNLFLVVLAVLFQNSAAMFSRRQGSGGGILRLPSSRQRRPSSPTRWPMSEQEREQKMDVVFAVVEDDPCARYQRTTSRSVNRTSSQGSQGSQGTRTSRASRSPARNAAFKRCADAGEAFLSLGASHREPCMGAVGATCVKKNNAYGCYMTIAGRSLGCWAGTYDVIFRMRTVGRQL